MVSEKRADDLKAHHKALFHYKNLGRAFLGSNFKTFHQYVTFALIGGIGAVFNTLLLYAVTEHLGLHYLISSLIAIESSIILIFFLNNQFTFENTKRGLASILDGLFRSNIVRSLGITANILLLYLLTEVAGLFYILSNIVAIFFASIINFIGERNYNWQEQQKL